MISISNWRMQMFNQGSTVFLLASKKNQLKVYRLNCDNTVKLLFIEVFNTSFKENYNECEEISFQLGYQLNEDEIWKIDNFNIPSEITYALENPDAIDLYSPADETGVTADGYYIKSIFMGEVVNDKHFIKFQRFEKSQILKRKKRTILYKNNMFIKNEDFCLNILDSLDAIYYNNTFNFVNYTNANKVLPLGEYYREATQEEVDNFKNLEMFTLSNALSFDKYASAHNVRGQIAKILDSDVLSQHTAHQLKDIATSYNINIEVQNNKIVIPTEKKDIKYFLTFLSEKIYKGPLSGKTLISSSTREKEE